MINTISTEDVKRKNFLAINKFEDLPQIDSTCLYGKHMNDVDYTIVIPTYKRTEELKKCLVSLINQKTQYLFQVVVVNNCQDEYINSKVLDLIKTLNDERIIYYINNENLGAMGNWNRCFSLARSKWVAMVHDDDIVNENWVDIMIQNCKREDSCDCIACNFKSVRKEEEQEFLKKKIDDYEVINVKPDMMLTNFKAPLLGAFIKRDTLIRLGGFEINSTNFEDYIFMMKLCYYGKVILVEQSLYGYGISQENDSNSNGLWDDILIGQYYLRKQVIKNIRIKRHLANFRNLYDLISCTEKHNYKNGIMTGFENTTVDATYIYKNCEVNPLVCLILRKIIKKRLKWLTEDKK